MKTILSEDHLICLFVTVDKSGFDWKEKERQPEMKRGVKDGLKESRQMKDNGSREQKNIRKRDKYRNKDGK